jgi:hypothetical protein
MSPCFTPRPSLAYTQQIDRCWFPLLVMVAKGGFKGGYIYVGRMQRLFMCFQSSYVSEILFNLILTWRDGFVHT